MDHENVVKVLQRNFRYFVEMFPDKRPFFISLLGSQNYHLDDEKSDIDCRLVFIPSLKDLVFNECKSKTIDTNDGILSIMSIQDFFFCLKKQNFNMVESIYSQYIFCNDYYQDEFQKLKNNREAISHYNIEASAKNLFGCIGQQLKLLEKSDFSNEKDSKTLASAMRLINLLEFYLKDHTYDECIFNSSDPSFIKQVKRGMFTKSELRQYFYESKIVLRELDDLFQELKPTLDVRNNLTSY